MKKVSISIICLAIALFSFLAGGWLAKDRINSPNSQAERQILYYTDPMNPGFRSEEPGVAPCGMPLEPVYAEANDDHGEIDLGVPPPSPGAVKINPVRQQLIGLHVKQIDLEPMNYTLRLYGKIVPDETKIYRINASTDSWVRALSDVITGSIVRKDQILAEVLAPAFYNAQVTYLVALNNIDRIKQQLGKEVRHQQIELADNQIRVAVQALQNLGITDAQVEELANTRKAQPLLQVRAPSNGVVLNRNLTLYQWFKAGEEFYSIADIGKVWVYADVYENEAKYIRPGMEVQIRHAQLGKTFAAKVSSVLPLFDPVTKTLKVQLEVANPRYDLRPDMFVDVEIPITMPPSLHISADAVIDSGTRNIVYVDIGNSTFEPRTVETGWRLGRQIEITDGLMPGEKVIVSGNFLVDSESRMKTAAAGIYGAMSKDPVCGMYVDEGNAKVAGRIATHGKKTYYFCMDKCKSAFEKEPGKYIQKQNIEEINDRHEDHVAMKADEESWIDMLEPSTNGHSIQFGDIDQGKETNESIGAPATFPGIVDWDGTNTEEKEKPPQDWSGWGKFPGAEYLGLNDKYNVTNDEEQEVQEGNKTAVSGDVPGGPVASPSPESPEVHPGLNDETQKPPVAAEPDRPASR